MSDNQIETMLADINRAIWDEDITLNDWEDGFISSMTQLSKEGGTLSEKQDETLSKIWNRAKGN